MSTVVKDLGAVSAYAYAVEKGYTGTEAEFAELMADYAEVGQRAEDAADSALESKTAAQTAATTATNKASEATTAATTATTKAGEASTSASTATSAKDTAVSASQTATTKATEATTAAATATSAKTDAVAANTAAQSAKTAAQTAQTGAETAAASVQSSAEQIATNAEDISQLKSEFTALESDGVVPSAEQILTDKGIIDSVPYHYRKTGGDGADRLYDQIVGGTVNYTQRIVNRADMFAGYNAQFVFNDGTITVTPSDTPSRVYQSIKTIKGHKYLVLATFKGTIGEALISWYGALVKVTSMSGSWQTVANLLDNTYDSNDAWQVYFGCTNNTELAEYQVKDMQCFDLTAMFGSTVADYIYQLEQTTAGAGVAFFKSLFPNDYYPYNAGELLSVSELSEHKMTGFNQWDEEVEGGYINPQTGAEIVDNSKIRMKNYVRVLPNTAYYKKTPINFWNVYFDANKTCIGYGNSIEGIFTTPENCYYIRSGFETAYGTTYKNDICINLSDPAKNGTYEPYESHSYPLDSTLTLRGLFKLDANNNLYADGDTYDSDGTVTRRYGIVDLGTLSWAYNSTTEQFRAGISPAPADGFGSIAFNAICTKYPIVPHNSLTDKTASIFFASVNGINIKDTSYTDAATFKAAMSGVMLVYELATPITEEAQPYTNPQIVDGDGTEEYVTTSIIPVGHVTKYANNLRAKLEMAPNSPDGDGDYIVRQTNGLNEYVSLSSSEVIQNINEAISDNAEQIETKADITELLKAFPTDTVTGVVASFSDGAELPLKSLVVNIDPVQDLHGQDAPWPAGGGKNLFDKSAVTSGAYIGADGTITPTQGWCVSDYIAVSNGDYVASGYSLGGSGVYLAVYDADKNYVRSVVMPTGTGNSTNVTIATGESYVRMSVRTVQNEKDTAQLEKGSTATAYAPYENICPISGHTQAVVTRTGVNVWDGESEDGYYDISNNGVKVSSSSWKRSKNFIPCIPEANYYFMTAYTGSDSFGALIFYDANGNMLSYKTSGIKNSVFATPLNCRYIGFYAKPAWFNANLSINSTSTDHEYHPYSGQSITIDLGQTVYGGTLDVLSGELVIDRAMVDLGSKTFTKWVNDNNTFACAVPGISTTSQNITCNTYAPLINGGATWGGITSYDMTIYHPLNDIYLLIRDTRYTDVTAFNTSISGVQLVYPLATPITVTLTPNELSTLLGANNIWSDAVEVTAEYRADPTLFIQRKIAEALS